MNVAVVTLWEIPICSRATSLFLTARARLRADIAASRAVRNTLNNGASALVASGALRKMSARREDQ